MSNNKHTDILVIGSGPGGYAAAFRAADLGREVTLVDKDPTLGGVCLNRGCIPSKTLLHISKVLEEAESLKKMGVTFTKPTIDIDLVRDWKNKVVSQLSGGIGQMAKARKVNTIQAEATFLSDNEVQLKSESSTEKITFDHCIIASGSSSIIIPGIPFDNENVLTSKTALDLEKIPKSLLVIGGGYIGLEMGSVWSRLGSKVTVIEYADKIIPNMDHEISNQFQKILIY